MVLHLTRGNSSLRIPLPLPATPGEIGGVYAALDEISTEAPTVIDSVDCTKVPNIHRYLRSANLDDLNKLNQLAERINGMTNQERWKFSGALDANSINGLDDILSLMDHLDEYILIPNVNTDTELGRYMAAANAILTDPLFLEKICDYLDFRKIGSEYYANHGGAYTYGGYILRRDSAPAIQQQNDAEPWRNEDRQEILVLELSGPRGPYTLVLPADEQYLDEVAQYMGISDFAEVTITSLTTTPAYLAELLPMELITVEDANALALSVEKMLQSSGELLKFCSILAAEQPENFQDVLLLDFRMDEYARVPDDAEEYGKEVLRRHGADDEIISTIDGFMDFAEFGEDAMLENHVRRTEFGLVERLDTPFPEQDQGPRMSGM